MSFLSGISLFWRPYCKTILATTMPLLISLERFKLILMINQWLLICLQVGMLLCLPRSTILVITGLLKWTSKILSLIWKNFSLHMTSYMNLMPSMICSMDHSESWTSRIHLLIALKILLRHQTFLIVLQVEDSYKTIANKILLQLIQIHHQTHISYIKMWIRELKAFP